MPLRITTVGAVLNGIVSGKSIKTLERPAQENEFAILKVSAVTWGEFKPAECKAMPPDYDPGDCPRAMDGDILISRANTRELVGAPVMVHGDYPRLLLSDKLLKLIPDEKVVDSRYLVRALRSSGATLHFNQCAGGSSGSMTNITQGDIRSAPLPLPPLPEQRRIAAILDQADALRAKRREALAQLDSLTHSIFIEMFGESLASGRRTVMGELVEEFRYGTSDKSGDKGYPALRIPNVANGYLDLSELKTVSVDSADLNRLRLKAGDLLFVRTNGNPENVGRCAVFEPSLVADSGFDPAEFIYASYLIRARLKRESILPVVLQQYLHVGEGRHALRSVCKTSAGQYNINTEGLGAIPIPSFPLALQHTFATRLYAVESLKATHRVASAELDALFASLQHRAFGGQL